MSAGTLRSSGEESVYRAHVGADGKLYINEKPIVYKPVLNSETLALVNDVLVLLATAVGTVLAVKRTIEELLAEARDSA